MRDKPEKLAFISKINYPLWITQTGNICTLIDGANSSSSTFSFDEPAKTAALIEELQKNSVSPQKFVEALQIQVEAAKNFTLPASFAFAGLVADPELLSFFQEYFKTGTQQEETSATVPPEIDAKAAAQISQAVNNCLRVIQADAKGIQTALTVLKEVADFHKNAMASEIEGLTKKCEAETAILKPTVDKNVKKLTQKADKALASLQKSTDRKIVATEKRRETYLHRLQLAETRRDGIQQKIETAKKRKNSSRSSSGSFTLKKYERDIDSLKKEVKAVTEETERLRKEAARVIKQKEDEFHNALAAEEAKLTQIQNVYETKIVAQKKQISNINVQTAAINNALESQIEELKTRGASLRHQVELAWKLDSEAPVLVQLPIYIVKYTKSNEEERYTIFTPLALSQDVSVLNGLKNMLSLNPEPKLKALSRPASKKLQETLSTQLLGKLQGDADFRIRIDAVCRSSNALDQTSFAPTLNEGLDEIEKRGYMTSEEAADLCKRVMGETA